MSGLKNAASSIVPTFITKTPGAPGVSSTSAGAGHRRAGHHRSSFTAFDRLVYYPILFLAAVEALVWYSVAATAPPSEQVDENEMRREMEAQRKLDKASPAERGLEGGGPGRGRSTRGGGPGAILLQVVHCRKPHAQTHRWPSPHGPRR